MHQPYRARAGWPCSAPPARPAELCDTLLIEGTQGAIIAAVSVGSIAGGLAIQMTRFAREARAFDDCVGSGAGSRCIHRSSDFTPFLVGGAIGVAAYVYGLIDAGPSARRANARHGLEFGRLDLTPSIRPDGAVSAQLRLALP